MPKFGKKSRDRLETCHPELQRLFNAVVKHFDCTVVCGHRTQYEQETAYLAGNSKLRWPQSKHNANPSLAVDVVPFPIDWNDTNRMRFFAGFVLGLAVGMGIKIRWGGDWDRDTELSDQRFNDLPHFELEV